MVSVVGDVLIADVEDVGIVYFDVGITGDKPGIRLGAAPGGNDSDNEDEVK
jgi:hypothetical protein